MKDINLIVACTTNYGIGYNNSLPWNIPEELKNFKTITTDVINKEKKNCIIMGKNTWYSLPKSPLANRINVIVSSNEYDKIKCEIENLPDTFVVNNLIDAFNYVNSNDNIESGFIIGGSKIYNECIKSHIERIKYVYMSLIIDENYHCDKFIDASDIYSNFKLNKDDIIKYDRYVTMKFVNSKYPYIIDEPPD